MIFRGEVGGKQFLEKAVFLGTEKAVFGAKGAGKSADFKLSFAQNFWMGKVMRKLKKF